MLSVILESNKMNKYEHFILSKTKGLIQTKVIFIKFIKQQFSYINKSISVSNLSFNFMSMSTRLYNHFPKIINKREDI